MQLESMTVIVLVGKSSDLMLREELKVYRAINTEELGRLLDRQASALVLIIEHIKLEENDSARQLIETFLNNTGEEGISRRVLFYVKDNDDNTCGIADEFASDIFLEQEPLFESIESHFGVDMRAGIIEGGKIYEAFGGEVADWDEIYTTAIGVGEAEIKLPTIMSKDDSDILHENYRQNETENTSNEDTAVKYSETSPSGKPSDILMSKLYTTELEKKELEKQLQVVLEKNNRYETIIGNQSKEDETIVLQAKLDEAYDRIAYLDGLLSDRDEKVIEASESDANDSELEILRSELDAANKLVEELNHQIAIHKGNARDAQQEYQKSQEELRDVEDKLETVMRHVAITRDESDKRIEELEAKLSHGESLAVADLNNKEKLRELEEAALGYQINISNLEQQLARAREQVSKNVGSKAEDVEKIASLEVKLTTANSIAEQLRSEVETANSLYVKLGEKVEELQRKLSEAESTIINNESKYSLNIGELSTKLSSSEADLEQQRIKMSGELKVMQDTLQNVQDDMLGKLASVESQKREIQNRYDELVSSSAGTSNVLESALEKANTRISELADERTKLEREYIDKVDSIQSSYLSLMEAYWIGFRTYLGVDGENEELRGEVSDIEALFEKESNMRASSDIKLQQSSQDITSLKNELREAERKLALNNSDIQSELGLVQTELLRVTASLETKEAELVNEQLRYNSLVMASGMDENGISKLIADKEEMTNTIVALTDTVENMKSQLDTAKTTALSATNSARTAEDKSSKLMLQVQSMVKQSSNEGLAVMDVVYNGTAKIIPVFGYSSDGITTMAVSLAELYHRKKNVLLIDMDMVAPKMDIWFSVSPTIKNIPGVETNMKNTSLGLFLDNGIEIILKNKSRVIKEIRKTREGKLDYFSGSYIARSAGSVLSAGFSDLLNTFGDDYDYLIMDMGKLGANTVHDSLIKTVLEASTLGLAVMAHENYFGIRNMKAKVKAAELNYNKLMYCINRCVKTKPEEIKRRIAPAELYSIFIEDKSIQDLGHDGKKQSLLKSAPNKDRISNITYIIDGEK